LDIDLSVITVNYNGLNDTCALIDTIPFDDEYSLEVIVVDNASKADEASEIARRYPQVRVLRSETNLGFAGGNNIGIRAARGRHLFLINNDTVFKQFNVKALIERLDSSPAVGMVCPKIRFSWDDNPIQFAGYTPLTPVTLRNHSIGYGEKDTGQYDTAHTTPYAHGAAMMVKREVVERVGLLPECFFLYYEELDWSMMITRAGYEIWYEPRATIYHKESRSTGQDSPLKIYYITRNRLLLARRNVSGLHRYAAYSYLILLSAPARIVRHLLARHPQLAHAVVRGVSDFLIKKQTKTA
jgi:hypothetical protein